MDQLELFDFDYSEDKWLYFVTAEEYNKWDQIVELELMMGEN